MKKSLYLKVSQQEANKRIWNSLVEKYKLYKQKHKALGYLYIPIACISFGGIAIVSLFSRISLSFKDIRFTPHYMQTVITYNNMSAEQANEYLIFQQQEYKKSLSYGNFSTQQRDSIDTTFELLFEDYKLPELEDKMYREIITSLSDVKQSIGEKGATIQESISDLSTLVTENKENITSQIQDQNNLLRVELSKTNDKIFKSADVLSEQNNTIICDITNVSQSVNNIHSAITNSTNEINELSQQLTESNSNVQKQLSYIDNNVESMKSVIEPIALYTEQKQLKEKLEDVYINERRKSQEKRKTTAYNREKGKKLTSFESALTDKQVVLLVDYCNKIEIFERNIEFQEMKDILLCIHQKPLKLNNNRYLSALFSRLYDEGLICKTWKSVASRYNCFVSAKDKELTVNDLYMANQTSVFMERRKSDLIDECIDKILNL